MREESFAYLQAWFQKTILRRKVEVPPASRRHRRVFLTFGICALAYSNLLLLLVLSWVNNIFVSKMGDWGYVATAIILYFLLRKKVRQAIPHVRGWWLKTREAYMRWKMTGRQQLAAAAVAVILIVPPFASKVSSEFVLEPASATGVRAAVSGSVQRIMVRPGDAVRAGDVLAELSNPELTARAAEAAGELGLNESALRSAQAQSAFAAAGRASAEHEQLGAELTRGANQVAELTLRAPASGIVTIPDLIAQPGEYREGRRGCAADRGSFEYARANSGARLGSAGNQGGPAVKIQVLAHPYQSYDGHIEKILPAAALDQPVSQPSNSSARARRWPITLLSKC